MVSANTFWYVSRSTPRAALVGLYFGDGRL
jgi:hypothetical protein